MKQIYFLLSLVFFSLAVPVAAQTCNGLNAQFITLDIPPMMVAGESYRLTVNVRNVGERPWQNVPGDQISLAWAGVHAAEWNWSRSYVPVDTVVQPGEAIVFEPTITAPSSPGVYQFSSRMILEDLCGFGSLPSPREVRVGITQASSESLAQNHLQRQQAQLPTPSPRSDSND